MAKISSNSESNRATKNKEKEKIKERNAANRIGNKVFPVCPDCKKSFLSESWLKSHECTAKPPQNKE